MAGLLVLSFSIAAGAQNTVDTQDAGAGMKQEFVRNAAGQTLEARTIGADGKLQTRIVYDYQPGYSMPQQTGTSYFPDGKTVQRINQVGYDPNSNFVLEEISFFDESGKHTSGHKLTRDALTGIYTCANWDGVQQKYVRLECPAGEEAGGGPEPLRRISRDEALRLFESARAAQSAQQKSQRMTRKKLTPASETTKDVTLGVVLPAAMAPGEKASGSVVTDPETYEGRPDLLVVRMTVAAASGEDVRLRDWVVEAPGAQAQPADDPFGFAVPAKGADFKIILREAGDPSHSVSETVPMPKSSSAARPSPKYQTQVVCVKGDVCVITGPFTGDGREALAAFDEQPAAIVAETRDTVYVRAPEDLLIGQHQLLFSEGSELLVFPVIVVELKFQPPWHEIKVGPDVNLLIAELEGADRLPDSEWVAGDFPKSSLERARTLAPGFQVPHESQREREERERLEKAQKKNNKDEKKEGDGIIAIFLQNATPETVQWYSPKSQALVLTLQPESFSQGPYRYNIALNPLKSGSFAVRSAVIPFLAPIEGQKFALPANPAGK